MIRGTIRRLVTSPWRILPDFVVLGAARCGTTTMYDLITSHPNIKPALDKELEYFSTRHSFGALWYRSNFPMKQDNIITGEATPRYLPHPSVPQRMSKLLPNTKMIILLRNPVDRAYSHYNMMRAQGTGTMSFEQSLQQEPTRDANSQELYRSWGLYADHIERWLKYYDRRQFLILDTTKFKAERQRTMDTVFDFLGVSPHKIHDRPNLWGFAYKNTMRESTRKKLVEFYKPHNEKLYKLLGHSFDWDV
ncbi:MAG: sulfotransferase domain-containing protein [Thaumarchaeota archaeon]|nr:sulfotransferase domain-containing protein [Nitrososphaerota archaeon]